ncbi:hypothetical protein HRI_003398300 [Hibiscus trionum]|uniref:Aluminum-activated malate transporter n=1 Tax=Hibiscus trionum TaxID=183268 RepID=A0A9W7IKR0_HIBTR|nr:hypothetical protein HRI_003398300 [Hibiscus trionum]
MEAMTSPQQVSSGPIIRGCQWLKSLPNKFCDKTMEIARKTKKLGQDDPRRIVHALKVGLAITLVSLFYYFEPLYDSFGDSAMWAVLTVVLVSEFSVGATLGKVVFWCSIVSSMGSITGNPESSMPNMNPESAAIPQGSTTPVTEFDSIITIISASPSSNNLASVSTILLDADIRQSNNMMSHVHASAHVASVVPTHVASVVPASPSNPVASNVSTGYSSVGYNSGQNPQQVYYPSPSPPVAGFSQLPSPSPMAVPGFPQLSSVPVQPLPQFVASPSPTVFPSGNFSLSASSVPASYSTAPSGSACPVVPQVHLATTELVDDNACVNTVLPSAGVLQNQQLFNNASCSSRNLFSTSVSPSYPLSADISLHSASSVSYPLVPHQGSSSYSSPGVSPFNSSSLPVSPSHPPLRSIPSPPLQCNLSLATLVAAALGTGAHHLATLSGRKGEPILVATFVFIIAAITTFMRFFPKVKARYDYGMMIFILTFCLVSVSGYRDDQVLKMARERFSTILIGCCASLIVCICIFPVWVGEDLHKSVAANMGKLANFLEAFGDEYFKVSEESNENNKSYLQGYRSVLTSKSSEETMANFARWEPGHGPFGYRHPWKMYLKVGNLTRDCAYKVEALNSYLNSKIQTPAEIRGKIQVPCKSVSLECSRALKEMASTFRNMILTTSAVMHIESSKIAAEELKSLLKTNLWEEADLVEMIPAASVASLLPEIIGCIEKISEAVNELGEAASFRKSIGTVLPEQPDSIQHTAISVSHCVVIVAE